MFVSRRGADMTCFLTNSCCADQAQVLAQFDVVSDDKWKASVFGDVATFAVSSKKEATGILLHCFVKTWVVVRVIQGRAICIYYSLCLF
jgi:hypothetical protein